MKRLVGVLALSLINTACTQNGFDANLDVTKRLARIFSLTSSSNIQVSQNSSRSQAVSLNGQYIQKNERFYIFVNSDLSINRIDFFLNGSLAKTENIAPYDMGGTNSDDSAIAVDTSRFIIGKNKITVRANNDSSTDVSSEFYYGVSQKLNILHSNNTDRSSAQSLAGLSLDPAANHYIFVTTDNFNADNVKFYLNGSLIQSENTAPFDMGGTNDNDTSVAINNDLLASTNTLEVVATGDTILKKTVQFSLQAEVVDRDVASDTGTSTTSSSSVDIMYSTSANRSNAQSLSGLSIKPTDTHYIFVPSSSDISKVEFLINNQLVKTENKAPYDLGGTNSDNTAIAADFSNFDDGAYTLSVRLNGQSSDAASVIFTISSVTTPTNNNTVKIMHSTSSSRSNAQNLSELTLDTSTSHYIFVPTSVDISKVEFLIDNNLVKTENKAPYDLGGTNNDDTAVAANLSGVSDGQHKMSVRINGETSDAAVVNFTITASTTTSNDTTTSTDTSTGSNDSPNVSNDSVPDSKTSYLLALDFNKDSGTFRPYQGFTANTYNSSTGYGWAQSIDAGTNANYYRGLRELGSSQISSDQFKLLYEDFHIVRGENEFKVNLPNNSYLIDLHMISQYNDPQDIKVYAEGQLAISKGGKETRGNPFSKFLTTSVNDGQLNIKFQCPNECYVSGIKIKAIQPQIKVTNHSGSLRQGQRLSLQGQNFGVKSPVSPLFYDDFEAGSNGSPLLTSKGWKNDIQSQMSRYTNKSSTSGQLAAYNYIKRDSSGSYTSDSLQSFQNAYLDLEPSQYLYTSYNYKYIHSGATQKGIFKMCRITTDDYGGTAHYNGPGFSAMGFQITGGSYFEYGKGDSTVDDSGEAPKMNAWNYIEMSKALSTPGVFDGEAYGAKNGSVVFYGTDNMTVDANHPNQTLKSFLLGTMVANTEANTTTEVFIDDVYIDNTKQRIEVLNNPIYNNADKKAVQVPTEWNNDVISFNFNKSTFSSGESVYIFIVNKDGGYSQPYGPLTVQ